MATIDRRGNVWRARIRLRGQLLTKTLDSKAEAVAWVAAEEARVIAGATAEGIRKVPSSLTRLSQLAPNNAPGGRFPVVGSCKVGTTEAAVIATSECRLT
jgi:hypothetical protein